MRNIINMHGARNRLNLHSDGFDDIDCPELPWGPASCNAYLMLLDLTGYIKETHFEEPIPLSGFRKWLQRWYGDHVDIERTYEFALIIAQRLGTRPSMETIATIMFGLFEGDTKRAGTELHTDFCNWSEWNDLCWISEDDLAEELKRAADLLFIIRIGDTPIAAR